MKFNITRRVKLATISWGWTYSEGNRGRETRDWSAGGVPGWDPVELEGPEWLDGEKAREDPKAGQERSHKFIYFHISSYIPATDPAAARSRKKFKPFQ